MTGMPKIKRIIFLVEERFSRRDYERFGVELLRKVGYDVLVWDLAHVIHPDFLRGYKPPDVSDFTGIVLCRDRRELLDLCATLTREDLVINLLSFSYRSLVVYRAVSRSVSEYAVFNANSIPSFVVQKTPWIKLVEMLKKINIIDKSKIWERVCMIMPYYVLGVKAARLLLAGGDMSVKCAYPIDRTTEILRIHTLDYDIYLKEKSVLRTQKPIAVFLDEFTPFNHEYAMFGDSPPINADRYYDLLNRVFESLESQTGLEVVIAECPTSKYDVYPDYFNGRQRFKGNTVSLVHECSCVLSQHSTAANYAIMFGKPVIFLTSKELDASEEGRYIRGRAHWFGKEPLFMEDADRVDYSSELNISRKHYEAYRQAYIKASGSQECQFWQIVADRIKCIS